MSSDLIERPATTTSSRMGPCIDDHTDEGGAAPAQSPSATVLVLESSNTRGTSATLARAGYAPDVVGTTVDLAARAATEHPAAIVLDAQRIDANVLAALDALRVVVSQTPVIVVADRAPDREARARAGRGVRWLERPFDPTELLDAVASAVDSKTTLESPPSPARSVGIVGDSDESRALQRRVEAAAATSAPVLLVGEPGTPRESVARAIHRASVHSDAPFVPADLARAVETLAPFPPPSPDGAPGPTWFIDEIEKLPAAERARLVERIAEIARDPSLGRVILGVSAATNDDRARMLTLLVRDDSEVIELSPLRARRWDVPLIVGQLLRARIRRRGRRPTLEPEVTQALMRYDWPGNDDELARVVDHVLESKRDTIAIEDLPPEIQGASAPLSAPSVPGATFAEIERHAILTTFEACHRNVTRTAQVLGLSTRTIQYRLCEYAGRTGRRGKPDHPRSRRNPRESA